LGLQVVQEVRDDVVDWEHLFLAVFRTGWVGGGAWVCFIFQMKMNSLRSDTIFFIER